MRYRVQHHTQYEYTSFVSLSHNQMRLSPRVLDYQLVDWPKLVVTPEPTFQRAWVDGFGNRTHFFSMEQTHRTMEVMAESVIERHAPKVDIKNAIAWNKLAEHLRHPQDRHDVEAAQFLFDSRYAKASDEVYRYAEPSFTPGLSIQEATADLTRRIHKEFQYDALATQVSTPTITVLRNRRGVCQDFAHLQIACLRSFGLPARYVSGYLLTHPPAGQPKLVGSDASHAWISVYAGNGVWIDFDPTNNLVPTNEHITIGWGRDYADICPIQGVLIGGGHSTLKVSVDVTPI
jgi:transglutaminase-like putative cysteine protease